MKNDRTEIQALFEEWFSNVMSEHLPMMIVYARRQLPDFLKSDAEDFAIQSFLNLWNYINKLGYIPEIHNPGAFLRQILDNEIYAHLRKKKTFFELSVSKLANLLPSAWDRTPEEELLATFEHDKLRGELFFYIDQLPHMQRSCVVMHYINELEYHEIALLLNISKKNTQSNTYRGLRRLREMYNNQTPRNRKDGYDAP